MAIKFIDPSTAAGFNAVTSNDGTFVIRNPNSGSFNVTATGFAPPSNSPLAIGAMGASGLQLVVTPGGVISGAVILPEGTPLRNAAVSAVGVNGGTGTAMTDFNGKYTIGSLPADTYSVVAGSAPYTHAAIDNIVVGAGQLTPNLVLTVEQGGMISGIVTGPSGAVAGAVVTALGADGNLGTATTAPDGSYTIAGLAPQSYSVTAALAGLAPGPAVNVSLNPQGALAGVNVALVASGAIQVSLLWSVCSPPTHSRNSPQRKT